MQNEKLKVIDTCRSEISAIDREIFRLIKKRERLSSTIGEEKRRLNIPDHDADREKAVFENAISLAKMFELPVSFATALQKLVVENSLSRQEQDRIQKSSQEKSLSILIIGGAGRMGGWFSNFLSRSGHSIAILDHIKPNEDYTYYDRFGPFISDFDLIIVSTPIRTSENILRKLLSYDIEKPVIFDISSVKAPVYNALLELKRNNVKVTSLHPMFGPSVKLLFGKHVIMTSLGVNKADQMARELFKSTSLNLFDMSLEEHDRTMALLLSLSHLVNITFILALKNSHVEIDKLLSLASPTFCSLYDVASKVFKENPHLYYEIQALNPHTLKALTYFRESLDSALKAIMECDEHAFVNLIKKGQHYLDYFKP